MSLISITHPHSKDVAEIRELVEELIVRLDEKYHLKSHWSSDQEVELTRPGLTGHLSFDSNEIKVNIKLGFMMLPLKSKIQGSLERALQEKLS